MLHVVFALGKGTDHESDRMARVAMLPKGCVAQHALDVLSRELLGSVLSRQGEGRSTLMIAAVPVVPTGIAPNFGRMYVAMRCRQAASDFSCST